jgi:hypothetical protein
VVNSILYGTFAKRRAFSVVFTANGAQGMPCTLYFGTRTIQAKPLRILS